MAEKDAFLGRWSRRKAEVREGRRVADEAPLPQKPGRMILDPPAAPETAARSAPSQIAGADPRPVSPEPSRPEREARPGKPAPDAPSLADVALIDKDSDIGRFLGPAVTPEVRSGALFKLWSTDPALAGVDDLNDLWHDWTDAAVAVPAGTLQTAYKIGQGFLTDEEAAVWDALGKPAKAEPDTEPERKPTPDRPAEIATATADGSEAGAAPADPATATAADAGTSRQASEAAADTAEIAEPRPGAAAALDAGPAEQAPPAPAPAAKTAIDEALPRDPDSVTTT